MIKDMDIFFMIIVLAWLGALLGSFAGAQVWRLRARQLREDKSDGEKVDAKELKQLAGLIRPISKDRSECLHCHHQLVWYDLIPIFSWVTLGGKCRYCHSKIGYFEPAMELGLATIFVLSYLAWPSSLTTTQGLVSFVLWLAACVLMTILFAYDARWFLLPFDINIVLIIVAVTAFIYKTFVTGVSIELITSLALSIIIMAGLYYVFSLFGWVGLGDSILGVGLAFLLGEWELAFLALFLANLLGCFMLIPLAISGKLHRKVHIPFGPFLIAGTIISFLWGSLIIPGIFAWSDQLLNLLMI